MTNIEWPSNVPPACGQCGSEDIVRDNVRHAFFEGERLVVVEGVPAYVCQKCGSRYFDDQTVVALDVLRDGGFPADRAASEIAVPVFRFGDNLAHRG